MSLSGIKKSFARTATTIKQKTGSIDTTVDREFDEEERRFKSLQDKSEKLQKHARKYLDHLRATSSAQKQLGDTVQYFYEDSDNASIGKNYNRIVETLDENLRTNLDSAYAHTVLTPLNQFCSYFPDIKRVIDRRENKRKDYDSAKAKERNLTDKPSEDVTKLPRAKQKVEQAREVYESINEQLVTEIPKLIDLRVPYLDPTFEAFIKNQMKFVQESYDELNELNKDLPEERYDEGAAEQILQSMRDLTICASE